MPLTWDAPPVIIAIYRLSFCGAECGALHWSCASVEQVWLARLRWSAGRSQTPAATIEPALDDALDKAPYRGHEEIPDRCDDQKLQLTKDRIADGTLRAE